MSKTEYAEEAQRLIAARMASLRRLSCEQAAALPSVSDEQEVLVAGRKCWVGTFSQLLDGGDVLVVVLVAEKMFLGISRHTDAGLMFSRQNPVRDATDDEIRRHGG